MNIIKFKICLIFIFCLISLNHFTQVSAKMYRIGTIFEDEIRFSKNFVLPLTKGKWEVVDRYEESYVFLYFKGNTLVRTENNEIMEMISVEKANLSGTNMGDIDNILNVVVFKNPYDGCYERPEYYLVEVYKKGGTHNCLVVSHNETNKEIYTPDDPEATNAQLKKWIKDNSIIIPPITFSSFHSYFSRLNRGEWYVVSYIYNPKILNSPKLNHLTEESSEFHKANIGRFPEHKLTMDKWISIASKRHRDLEKKFNAKEHHLLNLEKYNPQSDLGESNDKDLKKNVVEDLKKLNELYKSGILTEDEFKKAKNKILN